MSDTLEIIELNDEIGKLSDELEEQERHIKEADFEIERLNNVINKALHKLRASKDHFKTERENNVVTFVIRILEGSDK